MNQPQRKKFTEDLYHKIDKELSEDSSNHAPESDVIIQSTTSIFIAYLRNSSQKIGLEKIRDVLYTIKSQVKEVFKTTSKPLKPAVPIDQSVHRDYIICLENGKKLKVLKRYLKNQFGMTIQDYKERWGLDDDYPVVAPSYSEKRHALAKESRLGYMRKSKADQSNKTNSILGQK